MSSRYRVVFGDLDLLAKAFSSEADAFDKLSGKMTPPPAATGDPDLDSALRDVLGLFGDYHETLTEALRTHGHKLATARDNYAADEADRVGLINRVSARMGRA